MNILSNLNMSGGFMCEVFIPGCKRLSCIGN